MGKSRSRSRSPKSREKDRSNRDRDRRIDHRDRRAGSKDRTRDRRERTGEDKRVERSRDVEPRRKSRSPIVRRRSRSPVRDRGGERGVRRSRSPRRRRSRSNDSGDKEEEVKGGAVPKFLLQRPELTEKDLEGKTEEEQEMMKLMGFGGFDSTKGKHVPGNDVSAVHMTHKRKYRQYMNRKGGFNRPLDAT